MNKTPNVLEGLIVAIHEYYRTDGEDEASILEILEMEGFSEDEAKKFYEEHQEFIKWASGEMETLRDKLAEAYVKGHTKEIKEELGK